jgi:CheY-like chemotaxis protein
MGVAETLTLTVRPELRAMIDDTQTPLRILVVDDFRDAAETLALILRSLGHDARGTNTGPDALRVAEEFRPNVAFIDLSMPGMDGCEVARRLRRLSGPEDIVLVCVSVFDSEADQRRSRDAGFKFHLPKPVNPDDLDMLLRLWVAAPEQENEAPTA